MNGTHLVTGGTMRWTWCLPVVFLLSGCFSYRDVALVEVRSVTTHDISNEGAAFTVEAVIDNPNNYRIKAKDPDVALYLNGQLIGAATLDSIVTLDKRTSRAYDVHLHAHPTGDQFMTALLLAALTGNATVGVKGSIVGQAGLFRHRFPFELEQEVELDQ